MKNFVKWLGIIAFVAVIGFSMVGCDVNDDVDDDFDDDGYSALLDGVWEREDIVITFNGSNGIFTEIDPDSGWFELVKLDDKKFRNITYKNNLTWTGQELDYTGSNTSWRNGTTIIMTDDHQTLYITTPSISAPSRIYKRGE